MDENDDLEGFLSKYKFLLLLWLVGIVLLIGGLLSSGLIYKTFFKQPVAQTAYKTDTVKSIKVDI